MNNLKNVIKLYERNEYEIDSLCRKHHIPLEAALAVIAVETNDDDGFSNDGRLIIRFEAHKFLKFIKADTTISEVNEEAAIIAFRFNRDKPWRSQQIKLPYTDRHKNYHGKQRTEYEAFEYARLLDMNAAMLSISMGLPQIMGFNYKRCGFTTALAMFEDFKQSTINQINGMFEFFSPKMKSDLREGAFKKGRYKLFAAAYNGSGKAISYSNKIAIAVEGVKEYLDLEDENDNDNDIPF